jgi:uncharacterized coiled-coil protein SlyX
MSKSSQEDNDNVKANDLVKNDESIIQDNLEAEATEPQSIPSESILFQDEIQMTLKEFNQKIKENDRSIKRIEESMAMLYNKLDRTPETGGSRTSSNKKSKKKKVKKQDKKSKKEKKQDKKSKKKSKKLKGKGKLTQRKL